MALCIVKYAYGRSSQLIGVIFVRGQSVRGQFVRGQFVAVSCRGPINRKGATRVFHINANVTQ